MWTTSPHICLTLGCTEYGHPEACYDYGNQEMLDKAVKSYKAGATLKLECFNEPEARRAQSYMQATYPSIPFIVSWLEFGVKPA